MVDVLKCCSFESTNEPFIGVDEKCQEAAIFCIEHNPHKNSEGLMHQMLPLKHFKKTLMEKKFLMGEKIGILIDQYNNLMDSLIEEIRELKLRKNIEFSMLWLRELAKDEEEYELMRQIYRMDFKDLTCSLIHSIYFKIVHNEILEKKNVNEINCYKGIAEILDHLSQEKQAKTFLSKKIAEIEGILEDGEILKRALPDKLVLKENIKEVLLESPHVELMDIKYNKCKLNKGSRQYLSIFSKYPIVPNVLYHINFQTKYTNAMLGVCTESLILASKSEGSGIEMNESENSSVVDSFTQYDKHYAKDSIVFNCTNGCVYKDGMFESGSSSLTKGQKELVLKMRITSTNELLIMLGKNILCRQKIDNLLQRNKGEDTRLYLHVLLRTEGDSFDVDRDKDITGDQLPPRIIISNEEKEIQQTENFNPREKIDFDEIKKRNEEETINVNNLIDEIVSEKSKNSEVFNNHHLGSESSFFDYDHLNSNQNLKTEHVMNIDSSQSLRKAPLEERTYKREITKEIHKIHKRDSPSFASEINQKVDLKKFNENEKDSKINEIIKKERIDKILNEIKSKPFTTNFKENAENNSIGAKKLKEFQERKNSNKNLNTDALNRIKEARNKIELEEYEAKEKNKLRPQDNSALNISLSSYQTSEYNLNSPLLKSSDFKPLLMMNKTQQEKEKYLSNSPQSSNDNLAASGIENSPYKNNIDEGEDFRKVGVIHPSQKIFNLGQFDSSSNENSMSEKSFQPSLGGGATPIDRIKEFEFAKKSLIMKNSLTKNESNKIIQENETDKNEQAKNKIVKKVALPTLRESEENLDHSGAFNDRLSQESQVVESFDAQFFSNNLSPKENLNGKRQETLLPKLNRSQFSKIESKSYLRNSNLESSFGGEKAIKEIKIIDSKKEEEAYVRKPIVYNSIIDMGSVFNSENSLKGSAHIGHIISPKPSKNKFKDSSIIDESYDMNQLEEEESESFIEIRGTMA